MAKVYTKEKILEIIHPVIDPEVGFSIVDMGLVYEASMSENGLVYIEMTLTTPACPLGPQIGQEVTTRLLEDPYITEVDFNWTFRPMWDPATMASEEVRWAMGMF
ncbi:metal-sulfur cluster assembly factor [Spirochaeta cellobiosiphila]|uniref:metal-sulfur cluster assembly factor n=1 Tax=Spirochaeta cellobiosiphila TaxID=504483 RepID=UPI000423F110|nr:metal-sulfur cluster assembly factor [Spirochaeta cellobiosiphila]